MFSILAATQQSSPLSVLLLPVLLIGGMYFLMIRPQKKKQQAQRALLNSLQVGYEVMTAGGIFGTLKEMDDDEGTVVVEIAPGTRIRMVRGGISQRLTQDEEDWEDDGGDTEEAGSAS